MSRGNKTSIISLIKKFYKEDKILEILKDNYQTKKGVCPALMLGKKDLDNFLNFFWDFFNKLYDYVEELDTPHIPLLNYDKFGPLVLIEEW